MAGEPGFTTALRDGRAEAFARLTSARLASYYRLATAILGDPAEAEDATHDAAVRAWERWESLRDEARFDQWFGRIVINECRDRLRRRGTELRAVPRPRADADLSRGQDVGDSLAEREALETALADLSPEHRIVIVLHFYLGLDDLEIAERTGVRHGTVKSRLHYALRSLRAATDAAARIEGVER
jgi:RNA polymerase sigma-70 factor (ECF subfamily)